MFETWISSIFYQTEEYLQNLYQQLEHIQPPEPLCNTHCPDTHSRSHEEIDAIVV